MGTRAAGWFLGAGLAATAGVALAISPVSVPQPTSPDARAAGQVEPSGNVTFRVVPASPQPPTPRPTPPTPQPTPPTPQPSPSGHLPVTGERGSPGPLLLGLGATLLLVGWLAVRAVRRDPRPSRRGAA
ncbi:LPXTG cell wall anchor domain-containing protein [Micromonospora sp. NPDC049366]|uniref:LPXTG cell wall anchor domain-containing protein n=1 Tax=Micromonospora sp. NPDC049366 TaxID=3364271 RepID=UPI0037B1E3ED